MGRTRLGGPGGTGRNCACEVPPSGCTEVVVPFSHYSPFAVDMPASEGAPGLAAPGGRSSTSARAANRVAWTLGLWIGATVVVSCTMPDARPCAGNGDSLAFLFGRALAW